jgi:hypothetical protein
MTPGNETSNNNDTEWIMSRTKLVFPTVICPLQQNSHVWLPDKFLSDKKSRPLKFTHTINKDTATETEKDIDLNYALEP